MGRVLALGAWARAGVGGASFEKGVVRNGRVVLDIDEAKAKTSGGRAKSQKKKVTLAEVKAAHRKRSRRARTQDERKRAKNVLPPEKYHLWLRHPGRYDVEGVDTPKKGRK